MARLFIRKIESLIFSKTIAEFGRSEVCFQKIEKEVTGSMMFGIKFGIKRILEELKNSTNQIETKRRQPMVSLKEILQLHSQWLKVCPLPEENHQALWKWIRMRFNHTSNHIEGNTLTYNETQLLLIHGRTSGDHKLREYEEMKAHNVAFSHMMRLSQEKRPINEGDIRDLNKICLKEPFYKMARTPDGESTRKKIIPGEYKTQPNHVLTETGEIFQFAIPEETPSLMAELVQWMGEWLKQSLENQHKNLVSFLAELHKRFILIHPFDDGNGRVVRLLMGYVLVRLDFLPIIIHDRKEYIKAIQFSDAGDIKPLEELFATNIIMMLEKGLLAKKSQINLDEPLMEVRVLNSES